MKKPEKYTESPIELKSINEYCEEKGSINGNVMTIIVLTIVSSLIFSLFFGIFYLHKKFGIPIRGNIKSVYIIQYEKIGGN